MAEAKEPKKEGGFWARLVARSRAPKEDLAEGKDGDVMEEIASKAKGGDEAPRARKKPASFDDAMQEVDQEDEERGEEEQEERPVSHAKKHKRPASYAAATSRTGSGYGHELGVG
jgi:hypothetical protein